MEEVIGYLPTIVVITTVVVWLVRMEGKVTHLDNEVKEVKQEVHNVLELKPLIIQIQNDIKWIKKLIESKFTNKN